MKKKMLCTIIIVVVNLFLLRHTAVANNFLQITELFPNPIGRDTGKEWIELFNNSNKTINLKGWKIKSSSKKTAVKDIDIKSKSYLTIPIQLKNTSNSVEISDPTGKIISQVKYDEAQEGLSFSNTKTKWLWTKPTKGVANQKIIELKGNITTTPQIGKEFYFFLE